MEDSRNMLFIADIPAERASRTEVAAISLATGRDECQASGRHMQLA